MAGLLIYMIGFLITLLALPWVVDGNDLFTPASLIFCAGWPIVWVVFAWTYVKVVFKGDDDDDNEMGS